KTPSSICPRREAIVSSLFKTATTAPSGALVGVLGLGRLGSGIALRLVGLVDKTGQCDAARQLFVVDEAQGGHGVDVQHLEKQGMQPPRLFVQRSQGRFGLGAHDREMHFGMGVVGRKIHTSKRDQAGARDVDLALYESGQILLDLVGQSRIAAWIRSGLVTTHAYSARANSLISKISSWSPTSISLLPLRVMPQSKPDLASLTSSLKRPSESRWPVQWTTLLRRRRTCESRR